MSTLNETLKTDQTAALKAGEVAKLAAYRHINGILQTQEKALKVARSLTDEEVTKILFKEMKTCSESAKMYKDLGRTDLYEKEQLEADLIASYLPKPLTEAELAVIVENAITELNASSMRDMGKVIKHVTALANGASDGQTISKIVKEKLS